MIVVSSRVVLLNSINDKGFSCSKVIIYVIWIGKCYFFFYIRNRDVDIIFVCSLLGVVCVLC